MNPKMKILYVDDEEHNLILFKKLLSKEYEILTALNGHEGLEQLEKNPDTEIIFSDMQMPEMDGLQFISKAKEKYPEKKYSILTCFEITPTIKKALDTKLILKYMRKPINKNNLIKTINGLKN